MKTLQLLLIGLALCLVPGWMTPAQEREQRRPEGPTLLPPGVLERLDLNAEQKEKIARLQKEFQERVESARKKLDEALEQARQNQDRQKAQEALEAFRKETAPIHEAFRDRVVQVLTEDQRRRLGELSRREPAGPPFELPRMLGQLDLNAEQKEKIEKLMTEFREKHEAVQKKFREALEQARQNQDREKAREAAQNQEKEVARLHEELRDRVRGLLNEEQKRRFAEAQARRPEGPPPDIGSILPLPLQERLGLSPEQREKLARLQKETNEKLRGILNDEQNRKLEELKMFCLSRIWKNAPCGLA
jgi:hypothetical protein